MDIGLQACENNLHEHTEDYMQSPSETQYSGKMLRKRARLMAGMSANGLAKKMEWFRDGGEDEKFGIDFLKDFFKKRNNQINDIGAYSLRGDVSLRYMESSVANIFKGRYYDADFNFCMTYHGRLVASLGFDAEYRRMYITQIQGHQGAGEILKPFKWERALAAYAVRFAENNNIPEVAIQPASKNSWQIRNEVRMLNGDNHDPSLESRLKMLYDITAERSGFKLDNHGDYVKYIPANKHKNFHGFFHKTFSFFHRPDMIRKLYKWEL